MNNPMMKMVILSSAFWISSAFADWSLKSEESSLHFVSIKKDSIGEIHHFQKLEGSITEAGEFLFSINLAAVETNIPIRNERMNEFLFETVKFPVATGKGKLNMADIQKLGVGETASVKVPVAIELHGKAVVKDVTFQVAKLKTDKLWAVTPVPFILDAADFDLMAGVDKLRELALLPNIAQAVPVTASLTFVHSGKAKQ
ncbi:MAG: YceI family protein [Cellvibrionaceae bacterium]|nr:YceI family protein [Cellvibrionaceae bacterium]